MKPKSKRLFPILFGVPLLLLAPLVMLGAGAFKSGTIDVAVYEKSSSGASVEVTVPAGIVPIAMRVVPSSVMDEIRCEIDCEAPSYALDAARAAIRELSRCPDGVFVDVTTSTELVRVQKLDGKMQVYVDTPGETIEISIPMHTVASVMSAI